jgi:hypothetical protein
MRVTSLMGREGGIASRLTDVDYLLAYGFLKLNPGMPW